MGTEAYVVFTPKNRKLLEIAAQMHAPNRADRIKLTVETTS